MDQKARRVAVAKAFRGAKVALRKGHWRIVGDEVVWWVDLRAAGPRPDAALTFEAGAWVEGTGPEPEGGAIDCPLLVDIPLGDDPAGEAAALIARLTAIGTVAELRAADLPGAYLDASMKELLGR
ncbi:hypothetical protein [Nocardioides sp. Kera G14]|uniref:hypothetical protein n=1 Tax=Nocardioides sp. Kera G14 TaxID=2884264 RepID=UPI001D1243DD|nr:hypothetical protein [Nocardioides sp. Kera G14]UDY22384.1 hypothetical protein LH076_09855 [Nocardioides sp. Kera G14]